MYVRKLISSTANVVMTYELIDKIDDSLEKTSYVANESDHILGEDQLLLR